jgi:general stress protein 26
MTQQEPASRPETRATHDFSEIESEFTKRVARIVWCTVATVDLRGRPRSRILHPIYEATADGPVGWIATGRHSHKAKHLAANPYVSLSYWDQQHEQIYIDARADWDDAAATKQRIWDLYKNTPPPLGYDPAMIPDWKDGPASPEFGVLRLTPSRIELWGIADMMSGKAPTVWRPSRPVA